MNCKACNGTGWIVTDTGARKCRDCQKHPESAANHKAVDPRDVAAAVRALSALAYFPTDAMAQTVVGDALRAMAPSVEALRYIVRRACELYRSWDKCGVSSLRQIVCTKFRPADGIESGPTGEFPDGLPSETRHNPLAIPSGMSLMLPAGHEASKDAECEKMVSDLSKAKAMPKARVVDSQFTRRLREIDTSPQDRQPLPAPEPISAARRAEIQEMIDAEVEKRRHA